MKNYLVLSFEDVSYIDSILRKTPYENASPIVNLLNQRLAEQREPMKGAAEQQEAPASNLG